MTFGPFDMFCSAFRAVGLVVLVANPDFAHFNLKKRFFHSQILPVFEVQGSESGTPRRNMSAVYVNPKTGKGWTPSEEAAFAAIAGVSRLSRIQAIQLYRRCWSDFAKTLR